MNVVRTPIQGLVVIEPRVFGDERGFFFESYQQARYTQAGLPSCFVQDNLSRSQQGVLRGLHFQVEHPQGKLVSVIRGEVFDVAVDLRKDSPTFGQWYGTTLSDANHRQMYLPPWMAHGFCVLSETADFQYKCTEFYQPGDEGGLLWNDPDIGIDWPIDEPILADKDQKWPCLKDIPGDRLPRADQE